MVALLKGFSDEDGTNYELTETETDEYLGRCTIVKCPNRYELWSVRIFEPFQRKGYGTFMLREIIKRYKRFIKPDMPLVLYVYKDNEIAIKLYKQLGFEITGEYIGGSFAWEMKLNNY